MKNSLFQSIGVLEHFREENDCFFLKAEHFTTELTAYDENVFRIHVYKNGQRKKEFSYAVCGKPKNTFVEIDLQQETLRLSTKKLVLHIDKNPLRFSFYKTNGQLINQDEPSFGHACQGQEFTSYRTLQANEKFLGLGEKAFGLNRRGQAYTNWNTDSFGYGNESDPLYASIPFYIGINEGCYYGIFLDNSHKSHFNFGAANERFSSFTVEDGPLDYYFIQGDTIAEILNAYSDLTGKMPLPPKWSIGFQQCRYSYYPESEVLQIAKSFRDRKIPLDVVYFDIHYMDQYKVFTWDKERFPNPKEMLGKLRDMDIRSVAIFDPGIKVEEGYSIYDDGIKEDVFVKYPDGQNYIASVWPGRCHFPDFTKEKTRNWWAQKFMEVIYQGMDGFWNDMNEPAAWGKQIPDLIEFDFDGDKSSHKRAHNVYGMQMARATFEAAKKYQGVARPFVLTRAAFSGIQRYATLWTGDNVSNDDNMLLGVRMLNSLGLSGTPFSGYDVGGFVGEASAQLFARWISIGAFTAFFRSHSMINSRSAEPWSFGEETEEISRNFINLRYKLLPYIYSIFYECSKTNMPIVRSLAINHPDDEKIYQGGYDNEYFFGPAFLVCAIPSYQHLSKLYLPEGNWYLLYTDRYWAHSQEIMMETPLDELPVFVKGGSIVPMQSQVQSTADLPEKTLNLHVYKGQGTSTFEYFEDDGVSEAESDFNFYKRQISLDSANKSINFEAKEGNYRTHYERLKVYFHGFGEINECTLSVVRNEMEDSGQMDQKIEYIGKEDFQFINPISNFDPWNNNSAESKTIFGLQFAEMDLKDESFLIKFH